MNHTIILTKNPAIAVPMVTAIAAALIGAPGFSVSSTLSELHMKGFKGNIKRPNRW
jgi:hypothetical protein